VTGAIVGARRPDQLDAWLGAGALELSSQTVGAIDEAIAESGAGPDQPATAPRPSAT
jgi:aryl-alcohol dehydrogenase-like predicted oxidoreductase